MSTIKANSHQIGQSGTASNNFTWYQPTVPDGTVRLGQGNSGATTSDILVVSSTGLAIGGSSIPAERIVQGTAQTMTGATYFEFTGLPSWVKKITLLVKNGSLSGSANYGVQIGSGSYTTSGYTTSSTYLTGAVSTAGGSASYFFIWENTGGNVVNGAMTLYSAGSNLWIATGLFGDNTGGYTTTTTGQVTISGALDRIKFLSTGANNFTSGSVNIIYEG